MPRSTLLVMLSMKRGRDVKGSDVVDPGPEATDLLHAEMLALLDRLDEPAKKPWYIRDQWRD
jgi:hypothetical protein